jgi:hypothetical protein
MKMFVEKVIACSLAFCPLSAMAVVFDDPELLKIAALDAATSADTIDPGIETEALVRYANDKILRKYDKDHDGKVEGREALQFAKDNLSAVSESELERVYGDAYEKAEEAFANGVSPTDKETIRRYVPFVPRTQGFKFGLNYGQKGESGKDVETIGSSIEYAWGGKSLVSLPFTFGSKLEYGKENTFVGDNADKVERWTLQPITLSVGDEGDWLALPVLGIGYGRAETESIDSGVVTLSKDNEFVWEFGLDFPIRLTDSDGNHQKIASLKFTNTIRLDHFMSGKRSDELKVGFTMGVKEFKTLRAIINE